VGRVEHALVESGVPKEPHAAVSVGGLGDEGREADRDAPQDARDVEAS
jgi:hypothetical protein